MTNLPEVVRATVRGVPDVVMVRWPGVVNDVWDHYDDAVPGADVTDRRPLVLIDPEDADTIKDLADVIGNAMAAGQSDREAVKRALRSLAEVEPTPPEPQGLGAVVRSDGEVYVRLTQGPGRERWRLNDTDLWRDWSDIAYDAAVLAEGWSE